MKRLLMSRERMGVWRFAPENCFEFMHAGASANAPFSNRMEVMFIIDLYAEKDK